MFKPDTVPAHPSSQAERSQRLALPAWQVAQFAANAPDGFGGAVQPKQKQAVHIYPLSPIRVQAKGN
jgi:hypothetical protein